MTLDEMERTLARLDVIVEAAAAPGHRAAPLVTLVGVDEFGV
jgi:hypothetical protein